MGRMLLALLVVVMLSMTGYVAYSTFVPTEGTSTVAATHGGCCSQSTPACCSETKTDDAPACCSEKAACCQDKAACCETKGEAGTCCQGANKAKAIASDKKAEEPKPEAKKD